MDLDWCEPELLWRVAEARRAESNPAVLWGAHEFGRRAIGGLVALASSPEAAYQTHRRRGDLSRELRAPHASTASWSVYLLNALGRDAHQTDALMVRLIVHGCRPVLLEEFASDAGVSVAEVRRYLHCRGFAGFPEAARIVRAAYVAYGREVAGLPRHAVADRCGWSGSPEALDKWMDRAARDLLRLGYEGRSLAVFCAALRGGLRA